MSSEWSATTRTVRAGLESDTQFGAVVPPIHLTSTYSFAGFGEKRQYDYARSGNPTRDALAAALCDLEGGAGAVVTASGMASIALLCQLLKPEDLLIAPHDCYGGSHRLFDALGKRGACRVQFVEQCDEQALAAALQQKPRMLWIETPSNPLLRVVDIERTARIAREHGALTVVDNTFLSPVWQQPLKLGADIVLHSTTKYLNGHSDVVGGAVVSATRELHDEIAWWTNCIGVGGAPFDSYLTLRGLRTLHPRMRAHAHNAQLVAEKLTSHTAVEKVYYPGLSSHPQHALAKRQQSGFGAIVSFELQTAAQVRAFVTGLRCFSLAESLGGVESLVAHPATMTHAGMNAEARVRAGISDALLRLSIGIEDEQDLLADLESGLERAAALG